MIEYKTGDIFKEEVEAFVNTVNCVGIMGRGLALQFKKNFPENFKAYEKICKANKLQIGTVFTYNTNQLFYPRYIINFPTKKHWKAKSKLEDIKEGLVALLEEIKNNNITSIAIPPLGCGLGGLNWQDVKLLIDQTFKDYPNLKVVVFEPDRAFNHNVEVHPTKKPNMTPGRAALISLMERYLQGLLDPMITLLEAHKLMYFMQESGENLKLNYKKHMYGPYAENLRHVFKAIENHMIKGYGDGGDQPDKELELIPEAIQEANICLQNKQDTLSRFDRVTKLVDGFETPFGLELLATVHWVVSKEEASPSNLVNNVYSWGEGKKQFSEDQIMLAYDRLKKQQWA